MLGWIAASAFGSLSASGAQSIVDHLAGARPGFALTERILAFGSSGTKSGESSSAPVIRGYRFLKRYIVATMMLLAMSREALVAEGLGVGPIPSALVGSVIDSNPFHAMPLGYDTGPAQKVEVQIVAKKNYLITYFLDQVPNDISISTMPKTARDVVVARVSMARRSVYLVKQENSGKRSPPPKNLFRSQLKILEIFSGSAEVGEIFDVEFGSFNSSGRRHFAPFTSGQVSRDYVVVVYVDDDGQRRLAGFPISEAQYLEWESETRGF